MARFLLSLFILRLAGQLDRLLVILVVYERQLRLTKAIRPAYRQRLQPQDTGNQKRLILYGVQFESGDNKLGDFT